MFLAIIQSKSGSSDTKPASKEELEALLVPYMETSLPNIQWSFGEGSRLVNPSGNQIMFYTAAIMKDNFRYFGWKEGDAPIFIANNLGETSLYPLTSFTIEDGAHFILHTNNLPANKYAAALFALLPQAAIHETFKLNVNTFKSQKSDINLVGRASTVNFAGTDGQGNPFNYDIIVK